jgi:hypothetical protein
MSDFNLFELAGPQPGAGKTNFRTGQPRDSNASKYGTNAARGSLDSPLSKSWLFEIVEKLTGNVIQSFTLLLPPSSLAIKEPQRTSITKTFGNAFVDEYGADNIQITLKAISGTTHVFPTYSNTATSAFTDIASAVSGAGTASSNSAGFTGKNAFYEFRDKIMRYKDKNDWDKWELRVYDLADEQAYKCILLDFTLDRNSDNPLRYPFTISLFVYEKLDKVKIKKGKIINISKDPISALDDADNFLDKLEDLYQDVKSILNSVALLKAKVLELRSRYNKFLTQVTKVLTAPLDIAKNMIDIGMTATGTLYDTYQAGKITFERYVSAQELFRETIIQALKTYGFQISLGWQQSNTIELEEDAGVDTEGDTVTRSVNLETYEYSGLKVYTIKGDDTLQRIALNELGDENLWSYIASVNPDIGSNVDLISGTEIFLPIEIDPGDGINKEKFILTEDFTRDPYGTDIRLDSDGNIVIQENNNMSLISGLENVQQAIDLRLNTMTGSMIKQSAFGITAQAGIAGTELAIKYLKTAIRSSLTQDPRIESVENMIVSLDSDVLNISMDVNVIGAEESLPVTVTV